MKKLFLFCRNRISIEGANLHLAFIIFCRKYFSGKEKRDSRFGIAMKKTVRDAGFS